MTRRAVGSALVAVAMLVALVAAAANAGPFSVSCPGATGVDTDPATTVVCNVGASGTITDLNVELVVGAEFISDFDLIDMSHSLATARLYTGAQDDSNGTMDAIFDDAAGGAPPSSGDVIGTFRPVGPGTLASFNGADLAGQWTLKFLDTFVAAEGDSLTTWRLFGTLADTPGPGPVPVPGPAPLLLICGGLGALAAIARRRSRE